MASIGAEAERSAFSDLRSAMRGDRASDNDDSNVTVRGLLGLVLVCVLGIFFFFFLINTYVLCVWFVEFFVFGLLLYWGLISLLATTRRDGILPAT